jgi:signal transduction histidine kinase/DNA-binding response OmpR family regulator
MSKIEKIIDILLFEDNLGDAGLLEEILEESDNLYELNVVESLEEGLHVLNNTQFDVILLDLGLPDSDGINTFIDVNKISLNIPIIVLTGLNDEELGILAMKKGAQDYLIKKEIDSKLLKRSIRYAIERKKSEKQYLTLFNSIDEGFCTIEVIFDNTNKPIDYRFLKINPAFEGQSGLVEAEGKLMRDLAPDHEEHWFEIYGKISLSGKPMRFVNEAKALNRWYDVYAFKIGDPEGREVAILFNDITKFKETENELREYQDKLEEKVKKRTEELARSNDELKHFAYVASHDLREPLRMITSFLQLLERRYMDQLDQDANKFIGFAVDGAKRLDDMIKDLLEYSKVTQKKIELKKVDINKVLEQIKLNLKYAIDVNNAKINYNTLPIVYGDEMLIELLFQNIISNSIKYRSTETPKIDITAVKESNHYLFAIKDNGIGMSPEHLERIFTIFQRLHSKDEYEGTGIGLSIAEKIVIQHGGNIWAESKLGKGSTFYFTIPLII